MNIKEKSEKYLCNTYNRDLVLKEGLGSEFWDENGKCYIDFASGIAVNAFGSSDVDWANAVTKQAYSLSHTSNYFITEPAVLLAEQLCLKSGMEKVFLSNSGCEANECAIKAARKYSFDQYGNGRYKIITLKNSFHGRTLATLSATGQDSMHTPFLPMLDGFVYVEANNIAEIESVADNKTCAIMLELVQGEGGVNVLNKDYVKAVEAICRKLDLLLIIDEVQTGIGRSGAFYAYQQFDIKPDIVTSAKGLGGGLPIGATLFAESCKDVLKEGTHGSTFGGNPIVCAGALNIVSRIDEALLASVRDKGEYIRNELENLEKVKSVSGLGLMIGIEVEGDAKDYVAKALKNKLIILTAKTKLRLLPALNISEDLLEMGIGILKAILK